MTGSEQIYCGTPAAKGIGIGQLYIHAHQPNTMSGDVADIETEKAKLAKAIELAKQALMTMLSKLRCESKEIMEFQLEMLKDDDFLAPIFAAIEEGKGAEVSWREYLLQEIKVYQDSTDDYMQARYTDIKDIYLRVEGYLKGETGNGLDIKDAILVAEELMPSEFLSLDLTQLRGIAMIQGNPNNHVAILARSRRIPLVVNMDFDTHQLAQRDKAILDADKGELICNPKQKTLLTANQKVVEQTQQQQQQAAFLTQPALTAHKEPVQVLINVNDPAELKQLSPTYCDGIGLVRTELFFSGDKIVDEEEQLAVYQQLIDWADGKPVTIRTMDIGGDKPLVGIPAVQEANPFLGLRGLRFSLYHQELFKTQLRALCRAAALGRVKIMLPMVSVPAEIQQVRQLLREVITGLNEQRLEYAIPPLGMMIEVPAAAICALDFDADFYSIGTNDLVQYTMAAARDSNYTQVYELADPTHPAILQLIAGVVAAARQRKVELSLCGDMASDERYTALLYNQGIHSISVTPGAIGKIKQAISLIGT